MFVETAKDGRIVRVARTGARVDDDIDARQFVLVLAERLPNEALQAITAHCVADDACRDGQSKARRARVIGSDVHRETAIAATPCLAVDAIEFSFLPEPL
jgi:hypothetical protein